MDSNYGAYSRVCWSEIDNDTYLPPTKVSLEELTLNEYEANWWDGELYRWIREQVGFKNLLTFDNSGGTDNVELWVRVNKPATDTPDWVSLFKGQ